MRNRLPIAIGLALAGTGGVQAQSPVEGRVAKLESEMRAVQRRVFPGGAGGLLQPQIEGPVAVSQLPGAPATSALADLSSRVSSLESQLTSLTGQTEQASYRARQVQEQFDIYRRATDARLAALERTPATGASTVVDRAVEDDAPAARLSPRASTTAPRSASGVTRPTPAPATSPTRITADPARAERAEAIAKPDTGDAIEDAYTYGYRLWNAKLYPEAQVQLKKAAAAGPTAKRYSFAQNLLGRSYLDDGKPSLASMAFYDNYKKAPDGERAPESLYYLGQALQKLNKPADACKVYDELVDVYANKLTTRMKSDVATGRASAKCKAT